MPQHTQRFLELVEANGLLNRLPQREVEIAKAMHASVAEVQAWLQGAPMHPDDLYAFEEALPSLTRDLPPPPAIPDAQ